MELRSFREMESLWRGYNKPAPSQFKLSMFNGLFNSFADTDDYSWEETVSHYLEGHMPWTKDKSYAPLMNFVEYGGDGTRCLENAVRIHALIIDYDDGTPIAELMERYKQYEFILFTSFSHQIFKYNEDNTVKDTPKDKCRLIFPFKVVCEKKDWELRKDYVMKFAPNCDVVSKKIAQCFTTNFVHPDNIDKAVVKYNKGKYIDWNDWEITVIPEYVAPVNITFDDDDKEELLNLLKNTSINHHDQWWKMVSAMVSAGYDFTDLCYVSAGNPNHSSPSYGLKTASNMKSHWKGLDRATGIKISPGHLWNIVGGKPKPADTGRNDNLAAIIKAMPHTKKPVSSTRNDKPVLEYDESTRMHEYSSRYTEEFPLTDGDIFIKSPKGSGKTHQLEKAVQQCKDRGLSCLVVGHRVTLLAGMAARLGLTNYKTVNWDAVTDVETKYLAICINSIEKIERKKYDVVILDESEQVLQHFVGQTIKPKRRKKISKLVYDLVNGAKTVICLDADLSDLTVNFIAMVRGEKSSDPIAHRNNYTVEDEEINMWENKSNLMDHIEGSIESGKSVFVATNSKNWVKYFSDYLTSNKIKHMAITQDNSDSEEVGKYLRWVGNTDAVRKNEILLASPTLGTGVDIQAPFDVVYGIFETKPTTHYDFDQQTSRVRNTSEINVWVASQRYDECVDWHVIKNNLLTNDEETRTLIDYTLKDVNEPWFNMVLDLYSMIKANRAQSMNRLRENYESMKKEQGYTINHIEYVEHRRASADLKQMRAERLEQLKTDLQHVKELSYDEYSKIYLRKRKSVVQKNAVLRYEIEDFFHENVNRNVEIVDWYLGDKRRLLRAYEQFSLPVEMLHALDRGSMDNHPIDRKNLSLKVATLKKGLEILGLWKNGEYNFSQVVLKGNDNVEAFQKWGVDNAKHNKQTIGLKMNGTQMLDKPIDVIKAFTEKAGLKIVKVGQERVGNSKTYVGIYQLDNGHQEWLSEWSDNRQKPAKDAPFA